jgi:hypothetical protein
VGQARQAADQVKSTRKVLMLIAASAAIGIGAAPRFASAQAPDTRAETDACRDGAATGMYRRCALWMEGSKVRRGEDGAVVTRQFLIMPPKLSHFVVGDSALAYANLFERRSKQSTALYVLGVALVAISIANAECGGQYNGCAYDYGFDSPGFPLLIAGAVAGGLGAHFRVRATRAGQQAIWWNNARFAR